MSAHSMSPVWPQLTTAQATPGDSCNDTVSLPDFLLCGYYSSGGGAGGVYMEVSNSVNGSQQCQWKPAVPMEASRWVDGLLDTRC